MRRSRSSIRASRLPPSSILSSASWKSWRSTCVLPRRAAKSAASFTRLARSAPEKPGVPRASSSRFTSGARDTLRVWIRRIASLPRRSGRSTTTCRSKRPGRCSAGSRTSGRLVAASTTMASCGSKPSNSTSNCSRVCSRSSLLAIALAPLRVRPMASISSIKTMHGAFLRA